MSIILCKSSKQEGRKTDICEERYFVNKNEIEINHFGSGVGIEVVPIKLNISLPYSASSYTHLERVY